MKTSPTQRSLKLFRSRGWVCWITEKWNPFSRTRQDLGNFGDLVAWKAGEGVAAIQVTTAANMAARRSKILGNPLAQEWVCAGGKLWIHGWAKTGERGKRKLWTCKEEPVLFLPGTMLP